MKKLRSLLLVLILVPVLVLFTACGADGAAGAKGEPGTPGATGAAGADGEKGDTGATGDTVLVVGGQVFVIAADGTITKLEGTEVGSLTLYDVKGVAIVMDGKDATITKLVTDGDIQFFVYEDEAYILVEDDGEFVFEGTTVAVVDSSFLYADTIYIIDEDGISLYASIDVTQCDCTGTTGCEVTGHTGATHTCDHTKCARTKALKVSTNVGEGNADNLAFEYTILNGFVVVVDVDNQEIVDAYEIVMVDTLQTIYVSGEVYVKSGDNFVPASAVIELLAGNAAVTAVPCTKIAVAAADCTNADCVDHHEGEGDDEGECNEVIEVACTHTGTVGETKAADCTYVAAVAAKDKVTVLEYNGVAYFITGPVAGAQKYTSKATMTASGTGAEAKVTFTYGGKTYERLLTATVYTEVA